MRHEARVDEDVVEEPTDHPGPTLLRHLLHLVAAPVDHEHDARGVGEVLLQLTTSQNTRTHTCERRDVRGSPRACPPPSSSRAPQRRRTKRRSP